MPTLKITPVSPGLTCSLGSSPRQNFPPLLACQQVVSNQITHPGGPRRVARDHFQGESQVGKNPEGQKLQIDILELYLVNDGFYNLQNYCTLAPPLLLKSTTWRGNY